MTDYIEQIFADDTGILAALTPNYQRRDSQVDLARAIDAAITHGRVLLGEAPTGTGKSLAYLVPAVMRAVKSRKQVLIVTANKALQDQLIDKDLPLIRSVFQRLNATYTFSYALLKGRSNYVCQNLLKQFEEQSLLPGLNPTPTQLNEILSLTLWATTTSTGDQADAPANVSSRVWGAFSVSAERCNRGSCAYKKHCFAEHAIDEATAANVLVLNYDLFFYKIKNDPGAFWAGVEAVIFDEAHEAPNIARRCFGEEISLGKFSDLAYDIGRAFGDAMLARDLRRTSQAFMDEVATYAADPKNAKTPRVPEGAIDPIPANDLIEVLIQIKQRASSHCPQCGNTGCGTCAFSRQIAMRTAALANGIEQFTSKQDSRTAYWIDHPGSHVRATGSTVKIRAVPYRIGTHIEAIAANAPSLIAVSATMTSAKSFKYISEEYGLTDWTTGPVGSDADVWALQTPTPFNYAKQAKLIVPLGIPWPIRENGDLFDKAMVKAIEQLVHDCKGRTLVLFTSNYRLQYAADNLQIDYPLLVQGTMPNKQLAQMFRDDTHSVLLATKSFWTGLDVQGESLSCLIIDKLPLESLSDPLIDMMKTNHPDKFWNEFYYPRAAIELAQGAGRLIRSIDDKGVCVILDSRLIGKWYGNIMLRSLPFVGYSKELADAGKFL